MIIPETNKRTPGSYRYFHRKMIDFDIGMRFWKQEGIVFVEAIQYLPGGRVTELLRCISPKTGMFKLLSRVSENTVPISTLIKRNQQYPLQAIVCMKVSSTNG